MAHFPPKAGCSISFTMKGWTMNGGGKIQDWLRGCAMGWAAVARPAGGVTA